MASEFGLCITLLFLLNPGVHASASTEPNQVQRDSTPEFTFAPGQWPLFVPVRLGDHTCDFVLDTGCTGTTFDLSLRPQLGKARGKRKVSGLAGPMKVEVFAAPRAFLGPFELADGNEVMCGDLRGFAKIVGRDVHGILGMDALKKHILQIDFDEGRIVFLDGEQGDRSEWGLEMPLTYNRMRMPQIRLAVGDQPAQDFIVDTGCEASGTLTKDVFRRAIEKDHLESVDTAMAAIVGVVRSGETRIGRVTVGPFEYRGLIFSEAGSNLLGLGFLSRHVVTFDFPHDRLYLKKGRSFDKVDEAGMCGVAIERSEGRTVVAEVFKNEPAAKAGVRRGDMILRLNGRDANTYERWEIRDLMRSGHGKEIVITIQRKGKTEDLKVVLERQL